MSLQEQRAEELGSIRKIRWAGHALNNGLIFGATYYGVSYLPSWLSRGMGRVGTWLAYHRMAETSEAVASNLRAILPEASERRIQELTLAVYRSYADDTITFIRSLSLSTSALERMFRFDKGGVDLGRVLAQGRGGILVTGHFGSWELGSVLIRRVLGLPLTVVAMAEPDPGVDRMRRRMRESLGLEILEVRESIDTPLSIRRHLGENRLVAMLVDRHLGRDRIDVRFCGRTARFLRTPATMSYLTGAPLIPAWLFRGEDGRVHCEIDTPITVSQGGARDASLKAATQTLASRLEAKVLRYPHYWYQFYRYWSEEPSTAPVP